MSTGGREAAATRTAMHAAPARHELQDPELEEMVRRFVAARRRANLRRAAERSLRLRLLGLDPPTTDR
jgi:hypothetical protein